MNKFLFFILLLCSCLSSCTNSNDLNSSSNSINSISSSIDEETIQAIHFDDSIAKFPNFRLSANGIDVPLMNVKVNNNHIYSLSEDRSDSGLGRLYLKKETAFTLRSLNSSFLENSLTSIYPSKFSIIPTYISSSEETFTIYQSGKYVININNDATNAIQLIVYDYDDLSYREFDSYLANPSYNVITFKGGIFDRNNCSLIDNNNYLRLSSNTILFLNDETILRCRLEAKSSNNIIIFGRGIIDGSTFKRSDVIVPINIEKCTDVYLYHLTVLDPAAWSVNFYFSSHSMIQDINVISSRANGDGITLQSCHDINISNCYVRSFDDSLVVKNYSYPYGNSSRNTHGTSYNIVFDNIYIWTDLAQSMEIGYETLGEYIKNITFKNIIVFHAFHKSIFSIHNTNYANISDIHYINIIIEDCSIGLGDGNHNIVEFVSKYDSYYNSLPGNIETEVGNIYSVSIENVFVLRASNFKNIYFLFEGQIDKRNDYLNNISEIKDVSVTNFYLGENPILDGNKNIHLNSYASQILFTQID